MTKLTADAAQQALQAARQYTMNARTQARTKLAEALERGSYDLQTEMRGVLHTDGEALPWQRFDAHQGNGMDPIAAARAALEQAYDHVVQYGISTSSQPINMEATLAAHAGYRAFIRMVEPILKSLDAETADTTT